jgi:hypothetical protein
VAALIKKRLGVPTELVVGGRGEFAVWVGNDKVAEKDSHGFPTDEEAVAAVERAISPKAGA